MALLLYSRAMYLSLFQENKSQFLIDPLPTLFNSLDLWNKSKHKNPVCGPENNQGPGVCISQARNN